MPKTKHYKIIDPVGVVGFNGVIHKNGDLIASSEVPAANLKAWLRFGQVEEVKEAPQGEAPPPLTESAPTGKEKTSRK